MARDETLLTFDFEFEYSANGEMQKEFAVAVRAPGLDQYPVHSRMAGLAAAAMVGLQQQASRFERPTAPAASEPAADEDEKEVSPEKEAEQWLISFRMGLGPERSAEATDWIKRTLTKNARLASVGATSVPLNDAVWESIAKEGGVAAVDLVIGAFIAFFFRDPSRSRGGSGSAKSPTQRPATAVH